MMNLEQLNQNQKIAVTTDLNPTLVVAGAGTGKTRVLTLRFIYLMENYKYSHDEILTITFTNKAANEMKERISKNTGIKHFKWVGTFHSFCLKILKAEYFDVHQKNFTIIDNEDQISIVKEIMRESKIDSKEIPLKAIMNRIEKFKKMQLSTSDFRQESVWKNIFHIKNLSEALKYEKVLTNYVSFCHEKNYFDFNDLITEAIKLIRTEDVRLKWSQKFKAILIDEFQDTNDDQYELVKLLSQEHNNIFAVGDPDQMIYTWRGANPKIITGFKTDLKNAKVVVLDKNYRSSQAILNASNKLINNNFDRIQKNLFSAIDSENIPPVYFEGESSDDESRWIVNKIIELVENHGIKFSDICVLYRTNFSSRTIEQSLLLNNIPYKIFGGTRFYARKEIKDVLSYVKTCFLADDISIKRIINCPRRGISDATVQTISDYAMKHKVTFFDAILKVDEIPNITTAGYNGVKNFINTISNIQITDDHIANFDNILEASGYLDYLKVNEEYDRIENITELRSTLIEYINENSESNLVDFILEASLYSTLDNQQEKNNFVSLMTVHVSKGLEFNTVFISSMNEGIFPSYKNMHQEEKLEEERRIAYVALTRAEKHLYLTSFKGFDYHSNTPYIRSRFVDEIGLRSMSIGTHKIKKISSSTSEWFDSKRKVDFSKNYTSEKREFKIGDRIAHKIFGNGIIIGINGINIDVSFNPPYNKKTLLANHNAIVRILN